MPELGKKLREIRLTKGLSGRELSQKSGVARSLISQLETGKRQSTGIDTIRRLAQALEISPAVFLNSESTLRPTLNYNHSLDPRYNDEILPFMAREESQSYLRLAQKAKEAGLSPELLEELIDFIIRFRSNPPLP
ncbi:MAG: helix-turn-helix domain-containing protein [Desulfitobacteriaceae bacterium]